MWLFDAVRFTLPRVLVPSLLLCSCEWFAPPPPAITVVKPSAPPDMARPAPPDLAGPPALARVQIQGTLAAKGLPAGIALVVLTDGPCFEPGTHYVATTVTKSGATYRFDAFPPVGSKLDLCAAVIVGGHRKTPFFGRAEKAPFVVASRTGLSLERVDVQLRRGPLVQIPEGLKLD